MDKPLDTDEASSSKTESKSKPCNSAQLVWQIKGQYHVQCSEDEDSCDTTNDDPEEVKMNSLSDSSAMGEVASDSDKVSVQDSEAENNEGKESTSPGRQRSRRDWQLLKWQTRQVAKAFVDNTINCVLEDMGFVPLSADSEEIINDGVLEHEAVSMAILSHGLQRSDHETATTSSHVDSSDSQSSYKNKSSPFHFVDELSSLTKVKSAREPYLSNNQLGASCSFSSTKQLYQNGNLALDVASDLVTSEDRILVSTENVVTAEHSETHLIVQSHSSSLSPSGACIQSQADCDVLSDSKREPHEELPIKTCACNLSRNLTSLPKETVLAPFHKRKAEDFNENSKRCCHESSSPHTKPEHNHRSLQKSSSEESVSILYDKVPSFEHFDFMDAAVAVAIQKKGLSAMACTEYG